MKFVWILMSDEQSDTPAWGLYIKSAKHHFTRLLGTLVKVPSGWRLTARGFNDPHWLAGDLSLEDAQHAAKLFLCVGRQ